MADDYYDFGAGDVPYDPSYDYGMNSEFWKQLVSPDTSTGIGSVLDSLKSLFGGTSPLGPMGAFLASAGIGKLLNRITGSGQTGPAGYRGGIPEYTATRTQTPMAQQRPVTTSPTGETIPYRPGQGGITYFTPMQYAYQGRDLAAPTVAAPATTPPPTPAKDQDSVVPAAAGGYMPGGIAMLAAGGMGGRYLRGPGDGVSDSIPAKFEQSGQPARLADGEFVIDARTVSEIGNGSSEAGARKLYAMMDRVHKARKTAKRGKPSGADKFLPK